MKIELGYKEALLLMIALDKFAASVEGDSHSIYSELAAIIKERIMDQVE